MRYLLGGVLVITGAALYVLAWWQNKTSPYNPENWTHKQASKAWASPASLDEDSERARRILR